MHAINALLSVVAAAGGGHGDGIDWWKLGSMITNAVLFFGGLAYLLAPKVRDALSARRGNMAKRLEEAQKRTAEAEQRLAEYKNKLDHLEEEVQRIVSAYEAEAQADRVRAQQDTEKALERLARENEFTIQQEMRKAEKIIRDAAVNATLEAAEQLVRERITEADRRRLADQYVRSLEQGAPSA